MNFLNNTSSGCFCISNTILSKQVTISVTHCVKSVRIRSYSGPYFPAFGLNNTEYGHFLRSDTLTTQWHFVIFTGKYLCWSLFFTTLQAFERATSLKWDSWGICEILKSTYFEKHLWTAVFVYRLLHHILIYTIHYSTRFSFLQQLLYHAIKTIKLMTREAVSFEEVFH